MGSLSEAVRDPGPAANSGPCDIKFPWINNRHILVAIVITFTDLVTLSVTWFVTSSYSFSVTGYFPEGEHSSQRKVPPGDSSHYWMMTVSCSTKVPQTGSILGLSPPSGQRGAAVGELCCTTEEQLTEE